MVSVFLHGVEKLACADVSKVPVVSIYRVHEFGLLQHPPEKKFILATD
jgi:hypothetical protein